MLTLRYTTLYSCLLCIILYIYIYNPPFTFLPVTPNRFMWIIAIMYLMIKGKLTSLFSCFKKEVFIIILICIYSCIVSKGGDASLFVYNNFITLCDTVLLSFFLCLLSRSYVIPQKVIFITYVASIITFLLIMSPAFTEFIRSILRTDVDKGSIRLRSFGLSENLTFGYGLVQGISLVFALSMVKKNAKIILLLPLIFISILFNARIGFVPMILYFLYLIIFKRDFKLLLYVFLIGITIVFIILYFPFLGDLKNTVLWGLDFFTQLYDYFIENGQDTNNSNTISVLLGEMFILPETINGLWFGDGLNMRDKTDVGFFQQINFGGILLCLMWMYLIKCIYCRWIKFASIPRWMIIILILTLLISNVKGNTFVTTPFFRMFFLLYIYDISHCFFRNKYVVKS